MNERDYLIILYDFYGELFNEKQKEYFEEYYFNNLSLGEISEKLNVSRNAIHKVIQGIEEKLKLYKKNKILHDIMEKVEDKELKEILEELR